MSQVIHINRRTFLRGAGALVALPFFESFRPGSAAATSPPTRVCFLYVPNGVYPPDWTPARVGPLAADRLPTILRPLADLREYLVVASGLHNRAADKSGRHELFGQHARSIGAFLSAVFPDRQLLAGPTIDVVLSQSSLGRSRVPLLNITTEYAQDQKDQGYSEVFNYSLSWKDARTPIKPIDTPRDIFELLCGDARNRGDLESNVRKRLAEKRSVLDAVLEANKSLRKELSSEDGKSLEEYLEDVRDVEREFDDPRFAESPALCSNGPDPNQGSEDFEEHLRIMLDLLSLALRANLTQVASLMFGAERSERDFDFLSGRAGMKMSGGHHTISHHKGNKSLIQKYVQISAFHTQYLARFLRMLRDTREGEGNLLDHTLVVYGASMSDGNAHEHTDVPLLLAGKGNGLMNPGKDGLHVQYEDKPLANLYLTLLQKLAVLDPSGNPFASFGNSGGTLNLPG